MPLRKVRRIDFAPDEWIAGTQGMSIAEEGLYIRICALIYSRGGPIHLSQLHRPGLHGNTLNSILQRLIETGKVEKSGDNIDQKRCREELKTATDRFEIAVKRSRKANETRWGSKKNKGVAVHKGFTSGIPQGSAKEPTLDLFHEEPPIPPEAEKPDVPRRGKRLSADWQPSDKDRRYAEDLGLNPDEVAEEFRDYWLAKPTNATKLDWHLTWKTWCRNNAQRAGRQPKRDRQNSEGILGAAARAAARFQN
jgi:uncharacterized protein YdaU (DUF1376 family)